MIKVLHIFGKMRRGGAEMRTVELLPLLREKGIQIDFCTLSADLSPGELDETIQHRGSQIYPCPLRPGLLTFGRRFKTFLKQHDYDIVHSHVHYASGYMVHLAKKAGVKSRIVHFRTIHDGKKRTPVRGLYHRYMRFLIDREATGILAVCKGVMQNSWGPDWNRDPRCQVLYNGIDLAPFCHLTETKMEVCEELGIQDDCRLLINVGSFQTAKAHDILLDAMAEVRLQNKDVRLILVGEGDLKEQIVQRAQSLGIEKEVYFLGSRGDVPRLLKACDIFVLSSRREGLPGVVLEAIAAGLTVVATDLPGVQEIAEYTNGVKVVPVENSSVLAKTILLNLSIDAPSGKEFPEVFDLENAAEVLTDFYIRQLD